MPLLLGCIADDYTGASDLASLLRANGLSAVQTIGVPSPSLVLPDVDAVVIALKSRSIDPDRAVDLSMRAFEWLRTCGAAHVLFKICSTFDSTDRGNIGPVTDALRRAAGGGAVLVTPAFPETGREVFHGTLFVNGTPLHESPLKDHPLNPMHDANLVRVLARQSPVGVGLLDHAIVERGVRAVTGAMREAFERGVPMLIADAVVARHLDVLAEAALTGPLSVGASGLGSGLARILVRHHPDRAPGSAPVRAAATDRPYRAIIAGSCSTATRRQIEVAQAGGIPCLTPDLAALLDETPDGVSNGASNGAIHDVCARAIALLPAGPVLIASSAATMPDRLDRAEAARRIERALAEIAATLVVAGVGRLVVAGGETSGAVVDRLAIEAFSVGPSIAPGVPVLQALGRSHPGMRLALKSGNFGGPEFFAEALQALDGSLEQRATPTAAV